MLGKETPKRGKSNKSSNIRISKIIDPEYFSNKDKFH